MYMYVTMKYGRGTVVGRLKMSLPTRDTALLDYIRTACTARRRHRRLKS